jgi:hypothetical protein
MNGVPLKGVIRGFDSFVVLLESDGKQQMIYKHAISTVTPMRAIQYGHRTMLRERKNRQPMTENQIKTIFDQAEAELLPVFSRIEKTEEKNLARVLEAFRSQRIAVQHFAATNGYGNGDIGRDGLEKVFAQAFGTQAALVRPMFRLRYARAGGVPVRPAAAGRYHAGRIRPPYDTLEA